jgi:PAS domain S-box-containing protein
METSVSDKVERANILLVDDSPSDAAYFCALLADTEYTLHRVDCLKAAQDFVTQHEMSLILLDLSLPDSMGLSTLMSMRKCSSDIPVIILTGLDDEDISTEAIRLGAQDYLFKSNTDKRSLSRSIRHCIERTRLIQTISESAVTAKAAANALMEVEERLILSLKASRTGTWTTEIDSGKLIWDDQMHALFGFKPGEFSLTFKELLSLINPADVGKVIAASNSAIEHGTEYYNEIEIFWKDGTKHFVEARGQAFQDPQLRLAGICIDITERKRAQQEQHELAALVESSNDGIIRMSMEGTILSWNCGAERIYGYPASEMNSQSISKLIPAELNEELPRIIAKLKRDELIVQHDTIRTTKNGSAINVSITVSPVKSASGEIIGLSEIARDITQQKTDEKRLSVEYSITKILLESDSLSNASKKILPILAATLDWDMCTTWCTNTEQSEFLCVDVWKRSNLPTDESVLPSSFPTFSLNSGGEISPWTKGEPAWFPDKDNEMIFPTTQYAFEMGFNTAAAFPVMQGNRTLGALILYSRQQRTADPEVNNMCLRICAQLSQFMARKAAEEALLLGVQAEQQIARSILQNAPIGIATLSKTLEITEANKVFSRQFGLSQAAGSGNMHLTPSLGVLHARLLDVINESMPIPFTQENISVFIAELGGEREVFFDLTVWPVQDARNQTTSIIVLTVDVSERVKAAQQREDSVATLTHDLKNPLIGMIRMLDLFLTGEIGPLDAQQTNMLTLVKGSSAEMLELVGTLLEVYKYEAGTPHLALEPINITELVDRCFTQLTSAAKRKMIALKNNIEPQQFIVADRIAMKRVMMNLLDNAIKFTHPDTTITVSSANDGKKVQILVKDNGSGISQLEQQTLFKRFSQATEGRRFITGSGLGLYLCRQIVEAHKGEINCRSTEGHGTTFNVCLPLHNELHNDKSQKDSSDEKIEALHGSRNYE